MARSRSLLSETLKSITTVKYRELVKRQEVCRARKEKILHAIGVQADVRERVWLIHDSLKELGLWNDPDFDNIKRWTNQSVFDPTVLETKIVECERQLLHRLDIEERKLGLANVYSRLMIKCTDPDRNENSAGTSSSPASTVRDEDDNEAFEVVQSVQKHHLDKLKEDFARVVFEPVETDEIEIDLHLESLFQSSEAVKALSHLRKAVKKLTSRLKSLTIDREHLIWSIKELQSNTMLSDDKRTILQEFLKDEAVLKEIRDVLNMRLQDIENWSWDLDSEGMPVVPRQSVNGKWRIMMDEDVMQALLTHFIGSTWAIAIKYHLKELVTIDGAVWKQSNFETEDEKSKRLFFSPGPEKRYSGTTESARRKVFQDDFLLSSLPSKFSEATGGYDDENQARKSGKEVKQLLLKTLTTEMHFHRAFDKEVAVVQSDFQWFATAIPHSTVFATLRFIGFDDVALEFLRKFLEPPLNMLDGAPPRIRKRGLPMAHVFERLCGEVILFFLDIAVNQTASMTLYRLHDDLWLVGKPDRCARAWTTVQQFAKVMGLELNRSKTGSVYLTFDRKSKVESIVDILPKGPVSIHFLVLDPASGEWSINREHVHKHISRLSTQLANTQNVLDWIETWNSCIGRFFGYTFGEPAQCFGTPHLEAVLQVHRDIQQILFNKAGDTDNNVIRHLKQVIASQLGISSASIPDSFIFLPDHFGGLGLRNPFINLLLARKKLLESPIAEMTKFLTSERNQYEDDRRAFAKLDDRELHRRWKQAFSNEDSGDIETSLSWSAAKTFPTFEEYTRHREATSAKLGALYSKFLEAPEKDDVSVSSLVRKELDKIEARAQREDNAEALNPDNEMLWLLEYYRDDLIKDFGGIQCIERDFLPLGILHAVREEKVTWQMIL